MVSLNFARSIPDASWFVASLSMLCISVGISVSSVRSSTLSFEIANSKLELSGRLNKVKELKQQLEQALKELERREAAYQELETSYNQLVRSNRPVQELQPKIDKLGAAEEEINFEEIAEELEQTGIETEEEIENLIDSNGKSEDES